MDFQDRLSEFGRQLDELYLSWRQQEQPRLPRLFHYTTADGLVGITGSKKLWASNAYFLNDASEPAYAHRILRESVFAITAELGAVDLVGRAFSGFWGWAEGRLIRDAPDVPDVYVFCLSEDDDLLSQWRAYTDRGSGYVLGFSSDRLIDLARQLSGGRYLVRVVYDEDSQRTEATSTFRELANRFRDYAKAAGNMSEMETDWLRGKLRNCLVSEVVWLRSRFKTPAYKEEREWRIVQFVPRDSSQYPIIFRSNRGRLVPYLEVAFGEVERPVPLPIEQVTLGPTLDPDPAARTVELLLKKRGYSNIDVRQSAVPFRL